MKADPQLWQPPRPSDGVRGRRSSDHQACGAEKPATVRDLNRFVDLFGEAEVIRGNDEVVQCESSPPRPEKFKKFDTLAQSPLHHLRAAHHLRHDRGYFRSAKIEAPVELLHRMEDFRMG